MAGILGVWRRRLTTMTTTANIGGDEADGEDSKRNPLVVPPETKES